MSLMAWLKFLQLGSTTYGAICFGFLQYIQHLLSTSSVILFNLAKL